MISALPLLALISGSGLIHLLIQLVIVALIFWVLYWGLSQVGIPEPFNKIIRVILILAACIFVINALLSLVGTPFIQW